ncbi:hypothetical protein HPP92_011978 [Vanilla planifolia]|uniref:Uncharacterized protein n=1 Tax=Vanilla planifolia TaxID=51239 RepID=A0A835V2B4_VANPL|nr:hypothetical protein HPP92_011978 [Vanilla planifolia]
MSATRSLRDRSPPPTSSSTRTTTTTTTTKATAMEARRRREAGFLFAILGSMAWMRGHSWATFMGGFWVLGDVAYREGGGSQRTEDVGGAMEVVVLSFCVPGRDSHRKGTDPAAMP